MPAKIERGPERARELYAAGAHVDDIARAVACARGTVYRWLQGVGHARHALSLDVREGIRADYLAGELHIADIAKKFGVAPKTVEKYVRDLPRRCARRPAPVAEETIAEVRHAHAVGTPVAVLAAGSPRVGALEALALPHLEGVLTGRG